MMTLVYDGTFEGFLSAVFVLFCEYGYLRKTIDVMITADTQTQALLGEKRVVDTQGAWAERVIQKLEHQLGRKGIYWLLMAYLSECAGWEKQLLAVIRYALQNPQLPVLQNHAHPDIAALRTLGKAVVRESHRMLGLVRFRETTSRLYVATLAPTFNILPLIAPHFKARYRCQRWVMVDCKRGYGIQHEEGQLASIAMGAKEAALLDALSPGEDYYQTLWQGYFTHAAIPERRNPQAHARHLPKRYWQYLPEKQTLLG